MINNKKDLKEYIDYEKNRYNQNSSIRTYIKKILRNEHAILLSFQKRLRRTEYYFNTNKRFLYCISRFHLNYYKNKYGLNIPINTCGKGLKIMHLGSILINDNCKIGENVTLHIDTAIAAQGITNEVPIIGNNVVVGVGAKLIGGIKIANGIAIGAGAVVTKSFEQENVALAGVPARVISNNGSATWNTKKII